MNRRKREEALHRGLLFAASAAAVGGATYWLLKKRLSQSKVETELEEMLTMHIHYPEKEEEKVEETVPTDDLSHKIQADLDALAAFGKWAEAVLPTIDEARWHTPLGEGKWSLHEVLAHLYYWDRYTLETILPELKPDADLYFIDVQALNQKAWQFAGTFDRSLLLELFVATRKRVVESFTELPEPHMIYKLGGKLATVHSYLKIFAGHDLEHKPQFEAALEAQLTLEAQGSSEVTR